jgi:uncharacterized protein YprB with RNaseH-like and TPR domain
MISAECDFMKICVLDIETTGLLPWEDKLVCIGIRDVDRGKTTVFFDEDEEILLKRFVTYYERNGFHQIIGYNTSFDWRFLFGRCLKYRIPAPKLFNSHIVDLMDNLRSVRRMYSYNKPGKLDQWLQMVFGIGKLEKGESVKDLFEKREFTRIIQYNKQDVDMTYRLWERIRFVLCQ